VYVCMFIYIYIYIYIEREREREREREAQDSARDAALPEITKMATVKQNEGTNKRAKVSERRIARDVG
jgi:hypothetical protein